MQDDLSELTARLKNIDGVQAFLGAVHQAQAQVHYSGQLHEAQHQPGDEQGHIPDESPADSCCCKSHCNFLHHGGPVLRPYQALLNIDNVTCELHPEVPCFKELLLESMVEQVNDTEPALDNLTDFLLNFNSA